MAADRIGELNWGSAFRTARWLLERPPESSIAPSQMNGLERPLRLNAAASMFSKNIGRY
jgi:hypothetical protein